MNYKSNELIKYLQDDIDRLIELQAKGYLPNAVKRREMFGEIIKRLKDDI